MAKALCIALGVVFILASMTTQSGGPALVGIGLTLFGILLPKASNTAIVDGEYRIVHRHEYSAIWNLAKIVGVIGAIFGIVLTVMRNMN